VLSRKYPDASYFALLKIPDKTNPLDNLHSSNKSMYIPSIRNRRYPWTEDNCSIYFDAVDQINGNKKTTLFYKIICV